MYTKFRLFIKCGITILLTGGTAWFVHVCRMSFLYCGFGVLYSLLTVHV